MGSDKARPPALVWPRDHNSSYSYQDSTAGHERTNLSEQDISLKESKDMKNEIDREVCTEDPCAKPSRYSQHRGGVPDPAIRCCGRCAWGISWRILVATRDPLRCYHK